MKLLKTILSILILASTSCVHASCNLLAEDQREEIQRLTSSNTTYKYVAFSLSDRRQNILENIQYYPPMTTQNENALTAMTQCQDLQSMTDALKQKFYGTFKQNKDLYTEFLALEESVDKLYTKIIQASATDALMISEEMENYAGTMNRIRQIWKF